MQPVIELNSRKKEYWKDSEEALETVLEAYKDAGFEPELTQEILEDYFIENYGSDIDYTDLENEVEQEAFAVYNLIELTDQVLTPMEYDDVQL